MAPTPTTTTIVPARNAARFLGEALDSVLAQTRLPDELLVLADPSSSDDTLAVARAYVARPHPSVRMHVVEQTGKGIAAAWNQAIPAASGEILSFLSADDRYTPDKLAVQLSHMQAHPALLFTVARFRFFVEPGTTRGGFNPALLDRDLDGRIMETLVARREVFTQVGWFDTGMACGEDVDWYSRAADMRIPMALIPQVLLHKRVHDTNTSGNASVSTPLLMEALKRSLERKRAAAATGQSDDSGNHGGSTRGST